MELSQLERQITQEIAESVVSTSSLVDRAATWLLAGVGATSALIISNLDKTIGLIGTTPAKTVLWFLLVAALFGSAQKFLAVWVQIHLGVTNRAREILTKADANVDLVKIFFEIERMAPWYQRIRFRKNLERGIVDPLMGPKRAARLYNWQTGCALLEFMASIATILVVAVSI